MGLIFVLAVGLVAGIVSGIIGTGSSIMLLPVLAFEFGPREAVPIMAIAAVMANVSRILAWWREVDWRAFAAYALPAAPAAALGAGTLLLLPPRIVDVAIGAFLLAMIPGRRWLVRHKLSLGLGHLAIAGALIGFVTGIVVSTGPVSVPIFLAYGLTKGAFIATEAAGSLAVYVSKSLTFQRLGALPWDIVLRGLITGSSLMGGAFIAKRFVRRMGPESFRLVLEALLLVSGSFMLWSAIRA